MTRSLSRRLIPLVVAIALSACASQDQSRLTDAAVSPLNDFNLVRTEIPAVLARAQEAPYAPPLEETCGGLAAEIHELDVVLGPDLDAPASEYSPSLIERGTDEATGAAVGALRRTTEGVVPFRGWIRKLTGAERHARKAAAAITAGSIRRAFLKGISMSKECT